MTSTSKPRHLTRTSQLTTTRRKAAATACVLGSVALVLTGCGSSSKTTSSPTSTTPSSGSSTLASVCPNPVTILTDWTPEAEQGGYYELAASGGQIDSTAKTYTAPLVDPATGQQTGVNVQVIAGGPALGFLSTPELLHEKPNILMGADDIDTAIADSKTLPVTGIVAPLDNSLHILLWSPAKYHFTSIRDIGSSNATVLYFKNTYFVEYLADAGYLKLSQLDGSYTGSPARFVASGGGVVEQGFATSEPYIYTHELPAWNKSISYELTANTGYNPYSEMGEATPANVQKYAACFKQLVPMIQRAWIAYVQSPQRVNQLVVQLDTAYGNVGGPYDTAVAGYSAQTLLADKIVEQPKTGGFGAFSIPRVTQLIQQIRPVLAKSYAGLPSSYGPSDVITNQFIDNSIKFSGYSGPYNNTKGVITVQGTK